MKINLLHHILVIYLLILLFSYIGVIAGKDYIYEDDEMLENTQAFLLFLSMLSCLISSFRVAEKLRLIMLAGGLFFLTLLLREVDIEHLKVPGIYILIGSGHGRNIILISLWVSVLGLILEQRSYYGEKLHRLLFSYTGALYVTGGLFLLLGEYLDYKSHYLTSYEEISELIGFYLMFAATLSTPTTLRETVAEA